MKVIAKLIFTALLLFLTTGCAITRSYGPYMGRVVDMQSGAPVPEAVVFMRFFTKYPTLGGTNYSYVDALETLTDAKGEFRIPKHRIWTFRPVNGWVPYNRTIIFKPGFAVFPSFHANKTPRSLPASSIPENRFVIVRVERLKTRKERGRNISNALSFNRSEVPFVKYKRLFKAINEESIDIGSEPLPDPREFSWSK